MNRNLILLTLIIFSILFSLNSINADNSTGYDIKDNQVFFIGNIIEGADPISFQIVRNLFSKDKNHVYSCFNSDCEILENIDSNTFEYLGGGYYKDKNNAYLEKSIGDSMDLVVLDKNIFYKLERDSQRIDDIKNIGILLEYFYNDHNKYCEELYSGCLNDNNGIDYSSFLPEIPKNSTPGGMDYIYESLNEGEDYKLQFILEMGAYQYGYGLCTMSV